MASTTSCLMLHTPNISYSLSVTLPLHSISLLSVIAVYFPLLCTVCLHDMEDHGSPQTPVLCCFKQLLKILPYLCLPSIPTSSLGRFCWDFLAFNMNIIPISFLFLWLITLQDVEITALHNFLFQQYWTL